MPDLVQPTDPSVRAVLRGGNDLLARTAIEDVARLLPSIERRRFVRGEFLLQAQEPAQTAFFIERGVASVVKPADGDRTTEISLIGPEGFVGSSIVMADGRSPYASVVQSDQLAVLAVRADALRDLFEHSSGFRAILLGAVELQRIQIAESLVAALWHQTKARLARWLLLYRDRMRSDRLELTHEFIALMVGAQRPKVTETIHELEGDGCISASRGLIIIRDATLLQSLAQGSYERVDRSTAGV